MKYILPQEADFIIHNADVHTVDPQDTIAQAVAVRGGRVLAVGSNEEILALAGPRTQVVDAGGHSVTVSYTHLDVYKRQGHRVVHRGRRQDLDLQAAGRGHLLQRQSLHRR